jgi:hypothetical protein
VKRHFLVFLVAFVTVIGCKDENAEKIPEGIIPKEDMALIMLDMYLLEAKSRSLKVRMDSVRKIFHYYEQQILEDHQVSDSLYNASFSFYVNHPQHLTQIFEIMTDSLSLRERLGEAAIKPGQ